MILSEYAQYDGLGLAELVRNKELSPRELALLAIQGVEKVNPHINSVIEIFHDKLEGLDDIAINKGPFSGVPFLLKDLGCCEAGRKQEMGSRFMAENITDNDSFLMTRKFTSCSSSS